VRIPPPCFPFYFFFFSARLFLPLPFPLFLIRIASAACEFDPARSGRESRAEREPSFSDTQTSSTTLYIFMFPHFGRILNYWADRWRPLSKHN
jgi:hypothetical protein